MLITSVKLKVRWCVFLDQTGSWRSSLFLSFFSVFFLWKQSFLHVFFFFVSTLSPDADSGFLSTPFVILKTLGRSSGPPEAKRVFFFLCLRDIDDISNCVASFTRRWLLLLPVCQKCWLVLKCPGDTFTCNTAEIQCNNSRSESQFPFDPTGSSCRLFFLPSHGV